MKKNIEYRANKRRRCLVPAESPADACERIRTVDISRKGIGLISNHPMDVGEDVAVKVELSASGSAVVVWGKVRWVERIPESGNYRLGIRFNDQVMSGSPEQFDKYCRSKRF